MAKQRKRATAKGGPPPPAVPAPDPGPRWTWRRDGLLAGLAALVALVVFANSLDNGFVFDDLNMIRDNPRLEDPWNPRVFFTTSYWGEANLNARLYRPLTVWSFALDRAVFGEGPLGVHLMNVLANAVLAALVYALIFVLLRRRLLALATALLFAIHPVHTEVVANGVGRSELYAAVASLTCMLLHLRYVRLRDEAAAAAPAHRSGRADRGRRGSRDGRDGGDGRRTRKGRDGHQGRDRRAGEPVRPRAWPALAGAVLAYLVALLFKESAAVVPGLLLLMEWLVLERGNVRVMLGRLGRYLAYVPPLVLYLVVRHEVVGSGLPAAQEVMFGISAGQRMLHASETLLRYLGQLAVPIFLTAEYADYRNLIRPSLTEPLVLASLAAWAIGIGLTVWLVRRRDWVLVLSVAWFALCILPVSNLLYPIGTVRGDRLLFFPSLGFALALGCLLDRGLARGGGVRVASATLLVATLGFYGWRTVVRNLDWRTQAGLWEVTIRQNPGSAVGWSFVGDARAERGELEEAAVAFRQAFELRDSVGFFYPEAHNRYAATVKTLGRRDEAIEQYRLVLENVPTQPTAMMNLGEALMHDPATRDEAIRVLERLARLTPNDFRVYVNLAQAQRLAGRLPEAKAAIDRAVSLRPGEGFIWELKAVIESASGRPDEAGRAMDEARRLNR